MAGLLAGLLIGCSAGQSVRTERSVIRAPAPAPDGRGPELIPEAYHHFTTGNLYAAGGDDSAAIAHYRRALTFDPPSREIRLALAEAYARLGRYDEATITAESIQPRDPEVLQFLGDIYARLRNVDRRVAVFEEWAGLDSTNARVWGFLVNAYRARGDTVRLLAAMEVLAGLQPDPAVLEQLGFLQLERGDASGAERSFQRAVALDSTQRATRVLLGLAQIWSGRDVDSAYAYYRRAIDLNYYNTELRKRFIYFLLQNERHEEARENARLVLKMSPQEPDILFRLAILEYDAGLRDSAEARLTRLVTEFGDDAFARFLLGRLALERADSTTAEAQYLQSLALADTLAEAYLGLAYLYNAWARYDSAVVVCRRGLAALPQSASLRFGLGAALERAGRFEAAVLTFEELLVRNPDHAPALNYLGYMLADKGIRLGEALKLIMRAVALEPENGAFLDSYAWVLYKLGRTGEAAERMREALDFIQDDPIVFEHYGDILADLGRRDEAEENWRKALELDPDNTELREKLRR